MQQTAADGTTTAFVRAEAMAFSGPMPHPDLLREYEELCPGFGERSLKMVEEQAYHRRTMEATIGRAKIKHEATGQWMAFIVAIVLMAIGGLAVYLKEIAVGTTFVGVDFVALIGMFIYRQVREERRSKEGVPDLNVT
jgi:uncharacterized membrane protein